uniref:Uncharacterized protein n=1 Tax=Rhizoctonia solani TaxID=456999 RepID=N0A387_9AGAM|nr:hypothetical protein RSOL_m01150 [Rhizoctonia solani]AGK45429.1 hypothetical protein RSOL_m01150 [Rhizoctonia solani]
MIFLCVNLYGPYSFSCMVLNKFRIGVIIEWLPPAENQFLVLPAWFFCPIRTEKPVNLTYVKLTGVVNF